MIKSKNIQTFDFVILVVRDSYNMFASMYKDIVNRKLNVSNSFLINEYIHNNTNRLSAKDMWKQHLTFIDNPNYPEIITIKYNNWVSDIEYRKSISKKMDLPFNDVNFKKISPNGGGSSFPNTFDYLYRYKRFMQDKEFINLFDQEMHELNKKHFNININD